MQTLLEEDEVFEEDLPLNTVFGMPKGLTKHCVSGKYLIISPTTANWLVFADEIENAIFCLLEQGKQIGEVVGWSPEFTEEKVSSVVAQIIAKDFLATAEPKEKEVLDTANIHLTNGCNLRCSTCYLKATVASLDECTTGEWKSFLCQFKSSGGKILSISGGEPMSRSDFFEILYFANNIGLRVVLITNATFINKTNASTIGEKCCEVQVSIDGPDKKTNDSIRGKGTFEKAVNALILLRGFPCKLAIAMTPTPKTILAFKKGLAKFVRWAKDNIRQDIVFRITSLLLEGRSTGCMSSVRQSEFKNEVIAMCNSQIQEGWFDMLDAAEIIPNCRSRDCGIGEFFMVSHNGDIKTCIFSSETIGTIKDPLCVATEKLNDLRVSLQVDNMQPCKNCDLRYFCGGACRLADRKVNACLNILSCSGDFRTEWYKRLIRINFYVFEQLSS